MQSCMPHLPGRDYVVCSYMLAHSSSICHWLMKWIHFVLAEDRNPNSELFIYNINHTPDILYSYDCSCKIYIVPQHVNPFEDSVMASVKIIYTLPDYHGWFHCVCQLLWRKSACCWIHICHHSTRNVYWHPCLAAGRRDWHHSMPKKEVQQHKRYTVANRHSSWAEAEVESESDTEFIPDWLINRNEYEQLSSTAQEYRSNFPTPYSTVWLCLHELSLHWHNQKGMSYKPEAINLCDIISDFSTHLYTVIHYAFILSVLTSLKLAETVDRES